MSTILIYINLIYRLFLLKFQELFVSKIWYPCTILTFKPPLLPQACFHSLWKLILSWQKLNFSREAVEHGFFSYTWRTMKSEHKIIFLFILCNALCVWSENVFQFCSVLLCFVSESVFFLVILSFHLPSQLLIHLL